MALSIDLKPFVSTRIFASPAGKFETTQRPAESLTVLSVKPVVEFVTVTWAPPTTAPDGSVSTPPTCPEYTSSNAPSYSGRYTVHDGGHLLKGGRHQIRRHHIAAEVLHFVLLGQKHLPPQQIDGNVHARQRNFRTALLRKGRPRMHEHKRYFVRAGRAVTRPQQRYAVSVRCLHWLDLLSRNVRRQNACSRRQGHFQEGLRLILNGEFYFGERSPLRCHERCDRRTLGDSGKYAAVRETSPLQSQSGRLVRLPVETKRRLRGIVRQRTQIRVRLPYVHAFDSNAFRGREFHRPRAFDEDLARLALSILKSEEWRVGLRVADRSLHRNQELMTAQAGRADL